MLLSFWIVQFMLPFELFRFVFFLFAFGGMLMDVGGVKDVFVVVLLCWTLLFFDARVSMDVQFPQKSNVWSFVPSQEFLLLMCLRISAKVRSVVA